MSPTCGWEESQSNLWLISSLVEKMEISKTYSLTHPTVFLRMPNHFIVTLVSGRLRTQCPKGFSGQLRRTGWSRAVNKE